eukprot:3269754-Pleurochrysis_carterae.AAC.1
MGQANAARDSLYDLRECQMVDSKAPGFDLSGALMASGDFSRADFKEAQLSKISQNKIFAVGCFSAFGAVEWAVLLEMSKRYLTQYCS